MGAGGFSVNAANLALTAAFNKAMAKSVAAARSDFRRLVIEQTRDEIRAARVDRRLAKLAPPQARWLADFLAPLPAHAVVLESAQKKLGAATFRALLGVLAGAWIEARALSETHAWFPPPAPPGDAVSGDATLATVVAMKNDQISRRSANSIKAITDPKSKSPHLYFGGHVRACGTDFADAALRLLEECGTALRPGWQRRLVADLAIGWFEPDLAPDRAPDLLRVRVRRLRWYRAQKSRGGFADS
jgi:hypothetical protein